jgi:putative ABC transport system permease protein
MLYWRLAFRNLFRQRERLGLNLILLIGAFSAIVVFKGFKVHVLQTIQDIAVDTQFGHIQVAQNKVLKNELVESISDKMIMEPEALIQELKAIPGVRAVSGRLDFYGLLNSEEKSIPVRFVGFDPELEPELQKRLFFHEGKAFSEPKQLIISTGVQKILKTRPQGELTIVGSTLEGGLNAMDVTVTGVFSTGITEVDRDTVYLSLREAQKIYDSNAVGRLILTLKEPKDLVKMSQAVGGTLAAANSGGGLGVRTWRELSDLFNQVEGFFDFQNLVIELILLALVLLSVSNTMNMTVFERLAEIGTLRALGDQESDIRRLFLIEAILLGLLSVFLGVPLAYLLMQLISSFEIPILLPLASQPIPMKLVAYPGSFVEASLVCFFSITLASLWPARRGAGTPIVTALKAKI